MNIDEYCRYPIKEHDNIEIHRAQASFQVEMPFPLVKLLRWQANGYRMLPEHVWGCAGLWMTLVLFLEGGMLDVLGTSGDNAAFLWFYKYFIVVLIILMNMYHLSSSFWIILRYIENDWDILRYIEQIPPSNSWRFPNVPPCSENMIEYVGNLPILQVILQLDKLMPHLLLRWLREKAHAGFTCWGPRGML